MKKATGSRAALMKEEAMLKQAISEQNIIIRQQVKEIQAADGTATKFGITLGLMKKAYRELTQEEKNSPFGKQLLDDIKELDEQMKAADASIGNFHRNVGNYPTTMGQLGDSFETAFADFKSGNIQGGIDNAKTALNGLVASARAFIASPIGIAVTALIGIGLAAKELWDYNNANREAIQLIEQTANVSREAAKAIRQQSQAISDTYGTENQENIRAAKSLVENFGISYEEAFNQVSRGLARGGAANDEFFDSIREYPVFFAKAGYSVQEFIDLINESFESGVYSDKLIDAIKEADISLREQTTATRDALVNAFGAPFADDILKRVRTGQTSVKDALNEIAQEAEKTALSEQQLGQLTADIFRGAGEDVGGAAKMFELMRGAVDSANEPLTETEEHFQNLTKANEELQKAMDDALGSDSLMNFQQKWQITWVQIKTGFFEVLGVLRQAQNWFESITRRSEILGNTWDLVKNIAASLSNIFRTLIDSASRIAESFGLSGDKANGFLRIISRLLDPLAHAERILTKIARVLEWASGAINEATIEAEGFARTIQQIISLDFSNLKSIGQNAKDIRQENIALKEQAEQRAELRKKQEEGYKTLIDLNNQLAASVKAGQIAKEEEEKRILEEQKKREEEAAKKREQLQKKYAADQKRLADEAKRQAELAFREDIERNAALLEHYKLTHGERLNFDDNFILNAVLKQKEYLNTLYRLELEHAEKRAKITVEEAEKIPIEERTADQQKLINYSIQLEQQRAEKFKEIEKGIKDWKQRMMSQDLEAQKENLQLQLLYAVANGQDKEEAENKYYEDVYKLMIQHFERITGLNSAEILAKVKQKQILTEIERQFAETILKHQESEQDKVLRKRKEAHEERVKETEEWTEYIGNAIGYESQLREVANAYKAMLYAKDFETAQEYEYKKLQLAASVASAAASIAGDQTEFGKALAAASIAINTTTAIMKAYADFAFPVATAFAITIGTVAAAQINKLFSTQVPEPPRFNPAFEEGITNSGFQGAALVDEAGAEIHVDKHGKIKSMGKDRPNIRQVKKGDTIIPAPISKRIKDVMDYTPFPDLMMSLELNGMTGNKEYDFTRLENRLESVEKAITKKPTKSYIDVGEYLIEVTEKNGSTHQRFVPKAGIIRPSQKGLN